MLKPGLVNVLLPGPFQQGIDPERILIDAGNQGKFLAACGNKIFSAANTNLLQRFQIVDDKSRASHRQPGDAFARQ